VLPYIPSGVNLKILTPLLTSLVPFLLQNFLLFSVYMTVLSSCRFVCLHILSISSVSVFSFWNPSFAPCFLSFLYVQFFMPVPVLSYPRPSLVSTCHLDCSLSTFPRPCVSPSLFTVTALLTETIR